MPLLTLVDSDAALVRKALEGDALACEALVVRYQPKAHAVAHAVGIEPSSIDDVVQEAFLQAFRGVRRLRQPTVFGPWFLSIVRNVARQGLRDTPRLELSDSLDSRETYPLEDPEASDFSRYLWRQVAGLPKGTREVIFLYYYDGESLGRVAKSLNLSKAAVKYRLKKGMDLLRQRSWRELERALRRERPSQRECKKKARRSTFVVLASLPLRSAPNEVSVAGSAPSSVSTLGLGLSGAFVMMKKTIVIAVALAFAAVTSLVWYKSRPERVEERPIESTGRLDPPRSAPVIVEETDVPQILSDTTPEEKTPPQEAPPKEWFRVVRGRVVDQEDAPINSARVALWRMAHGESGVLGEHPPESVVSTSADGSFDVGPLDMSSQYFVRVQRGGYGTRCREYVRASEFLLFRLAAGSRIFGTVQEVAEEPLASRLLVTAWSAGPDGNRNYLDGSWVDPGGSFELQGVPPGKTVVFLKSKPFRTQSQRLLVEAGKDYEVVFSIDEGCAFRGRLIDGLSGVAIEGARVSLNRNRLKNAASDSSGIFELEGLHCEQRIAQDVTVEAPGYGIRSLRASSSGTEFELFPAATVAGHVVDEKGDPLQDVYVVAEQFVGTGDRRGRLGTRTRSSAEGRFVADGLFAVERVTTRRGPSLPAGSVVQGPDCVLTLRKPGHETAVVTVSMSLGPDEYHYELDDIVLGPGAEVSGRVVDDVDGAPVLGARVFVFYRGEATARSVKREGWGAILTTTTDDDGRFRGMGLSDAVGDSSDPKYEVHVSAPGYTDQTVDVEDVEDDILIRLETIDEDTVADEPIEDDGNTLTVEAAQGDMVVLSGGRNRDVSLDQEYSVYRGEVYRGRIKIVEVLEDLSGGKILDRRAGKPIRVGDRALLAER